MIRVWLVLMFLLPATALAEATEPDVQQLAEWMAGSFSSAAHAAEDSAYYDIRLEMAPIWPDRDDAAGVSMPKASRSGARRRAPTCSCVKKQSLNRDTPAGVPPGGSWK